jgi:acetoin utilization deacetylase AcuC-like enzyme
MIFSDDPTVFTMSMHGEKNFPFRKQTSDLDIALADCTEDAEYLASLEYGVIKALDLAEADLAIYLAGADPYAGDRLGRLSLTKEGLAARDKFVFKSCFDRKIPIAVTMGGGYANDIQDIVDIHVRTVQEAVNFHQQINQ